MNKEYKGVPVNTSDKPPKQDDRLDRDNGRLSDCVKRFPNGSLPFSGFPSAELIK